MTNSNAVAPPRAAPAIANNEQIAAANKWRALAIARGYRTDGNTLPKVIAEGELLRNVRARYDRWKNFAEDAAERDLAEEIGEPNLERGDARPKMSKHLAHLWAVAKANGLASEPRGERLEKANEVLMNHEIEPVESWNDLDESGARCLASAIDAKILTWGELSLALPLDGEAA